MSNISDALTQEFMRKPGDYGHMCQVFISALKAARPGLRVPDPKDIEHLSPEEVFGSVVALNHDRISSIAPISFQEAKRIISSRARQIFEDWHKLNDILRGHEDVIAKRWISKTRDKRKRILQEVWPRMATNHRPDFHARWLESSKRRQLGANARDAHLLPFINMEDLLIAKNLLLLLNSRGHNKPDVFAHADIRTVRYARYSKSIEYPNLQSYTMFLSGQLPPNIRQIGFR